LKVAILYRDGLKKEYEVESVITETEQWKLLSQGGLMTLIPHSSVRELMIYKKDEIDRAQKLAG
jgi:hypothetical protein